MLMSILEWNIWQLTVTIVAGLVTIIVGIATYFWNRTQRRSFLFNQQYQNDNHIFQLCQALSDPSPRLQMAAAALLFERLHVKSNDRERRAIVQALLAAIIDDPHDESRPPASSEFCKYVADSVLEVLKTSKGYGTANAPASKFYWQRARCAGAYWAGADLRGADFFGATLDGASLRRATLYGTVFYEASLRGVKLMGADIRKADFRAADLSGADLSDQEADDKGTAQSTLWEGAKFKDAIYDSKTKLPRGLDPVVSEMKPGDASPKQLAS